MKQGLTNLVNKYKRDKLVKDEKRNAAVEEATYLQDQGQPEDVLDDTQLLFNQDEAHERNILHVLLEFGLKPWDEERTMADYIIEELEQFHLDNPQLEKLYEEYKKWYRARIGTYHQDHAVP
jgi:DNA primase